jgi:hypothetical protein
MIYKNDYYTFLHTNFDNCQVRKKMRTLRDRPRLNGAFYNSIHMLYICAKPFGGFTFWLFS